MEPEQQPVTGREDKEKLSSEIRALADFYAAFNARDLEKMEQNWSLTDEAVMDNPVGGIKRGWAEIKSVYQKIFGGSACIEVEFYDYTLHRGGEIFYATGRERGTLKTPELTLEIRIRTTRIFRLIENQWKQIHHHGSIDEPEMLQKYQQAVKGGGK